MEIWDIFIMEFHKQFQDHTQKQKVIQHLKTLCLKSNEIDQYIVDFEQNCWEAGYDP